MTNIKIENFCEEQNKEFQLYYSYLNNPFYVQIFMKLLYFMKDKRLVEKIYNMIKLNHEYVIDKLLKIDILISYYKKNNLIDKSEIGKFFRFYEKNKKNINVKNSKDLLKLFYKLIYYERCIECLRECFYIFSNYRACIYFMTPSIDFYNLPKKKVKLLKDVVNHFKDNINTMNQIISKIYLGDEGTWGSPCYSSANAMFETLLILKSHFSDPLKMLNIKFKVHKKCNKKDIVKKICEAYLIHKLKNSDIDNKINEKNINNVSQFIVNIKRLGYDMWYTIPLIFDTIYEEYELSSIKEAHIINNDKIYFQKTNNVLGFMCYILVKDGFINNVNIFKGFNI
jgi:hypothetical protein